MSAKEPSLRGISCSTSSSPIFTFQVEFKMDVAATSFLESATQRTLHAHNFSRSSSEATHVLADLLGRYYTLLASTCARYAEHAARCATAEGAQPRTDTGACSDADPEAHKAALERPRLAAPAAPERVPRALGAAHCERRRP